MANEKTPVSWGDVDGMWEELGRPGVKENLTPRLAPSAQAGQTPTFEALPKNPQLREVFLGQADSSI
jgi:hypothetical protein